MIPSDLATRLRAFMESTVLPLAATNPVADELPRYETGQRFTAQIQNPLPDGTFRALVAGKTLTLALPDSAKSGDVLELVVTGHEGDTVTARHAEGENAPAAAQGRPTLSQAGRLISQLLTGRFAQAEPVPLRGGEPLLPAPPANGAQIAPQLQQAVRQSGLFFEAHQARWLAGEMPLESLLAEPQAKFAQPQAEGTQAETQAPQRMPVPPARAELPERMAMLGESASPNPPAPSPQRVEQQSAALAAAIERTTPPNERDNLRIPEKLMPMVFQQLETLASHQIAWQGQVWPGQQMQWTVFDPERDASQPGAEDGDTPWSSTVKLSLPRLGGVAAHLVLGRNGLALRLEAEEGAATQRLVAAQQELADALAGAGITVAGLNIMQAKPSDHGPG